MMKHDSTTVAICNRRSLNSKSMPIDNVDKKELPKRLSMWKLKRNVNDCGLSESPKSPIIKAFDFLTWSRNRLTTNKIATNAMVATTPTTNLKMANVTPLKLNDDENVLNYQRNIFRNSGGIIRDILNEKSMKKSSNVLQKKKSKNAGHIRQVVTRNKSLDINELINCVERELNSNNKSTDKENKCQRFLDDTFLESIQKAKEASSQFHDNDHHDDDDDDNDEYDNLDGNDCQAEDVNEQNNERLLFHASSTDEEDAYYHQQQKELEKLYQCTTMANGSFKSAKTIGGNTGNGKGNANSNGNTNDPAASKHILFNDENTVYLIKKEMPVNKCLEGTSIMKQTTENILKARLKLKKLDVTANEDLKTTILNNCHVNTAGTVITSSMNHNNSRNNSLERIKLRRQNTNPESYYNNRMHHFYINHTEMDCKRDKKSLMKCQQEIQAKSLNSIKCKLRNGQRQRPKSLTDGICLTSCHLYNDSNNDNEIKSGQKAVHNNNSGGGSGRGGGDGGGSGNVSSSSIGSNNGNEHPTKMDKTRKKLSFREPIHCNRTHNNNRNNNSDVVLSSLNVSTDKSKLNVNVKATMQHCEQLINNNNNNNNNKSNNNNNNNDNNYHNNNNNNKMMMKVKHPTSDYAGTKEQSQAMRIVRTVGQAFEVCHKFNIHKNSADHNNEDRSDISSSELLDLETRSDQQQLNHSDDEQHNNNKKDRLPATPTDLSLPIQRPNHLELVPQTNLHKTASILTDEDKSPTSPSSPTREISKLKDQLEQQALQTRQALAQLMLVREQLLTETNARIEAQARTQQLLQQNRELLEHLASLGVYNEQQSSGLTSANIAMAPQSQLQMLLQATATNANNNLASINQQINNLGTINQQLTSLSHQLSGLNQQTQNLHNFQHATHPPASSAAAAAAAAAAVMAAAASHVQHHTPNALTPIPTTPIPTSLQQQQQQQQPSPIHLNITTVNATTSGTNTLSLSGSPYPSMNHLQTINSHLQQQQQQQHTQQQQYSTSPMPHINVQQQQQPQQLQTLQQPQQQSVSTTELFTKDLYQINQELLQRLQSLNLGVTSSPHHHHQQQQQQQHLNNGYINSNSPNPIIQGTASPTPNNSYFFANPLSAACAISTNHHNNSNNSNSTNNSNNNNNSNYLSAPMPLNSIIGGRGNLTPSPMSTLNRNSYSNSPITDEMRLSIDQNLNFLDEQQQTQSLQQLQTQQQQQQSQQHQQQQQQQQHLYVKSLASQLTNLSTSNGNLTPTGSTENSRSSSTVESPHTSIVRSNSNLSSSHTPHYHNHQTHQTNPHKNNNNNNNKHNNNHNNNNDNNNEISSSSSSPRYHNTVMLKVTDESGNVTNQRKLSATPSFITRSTSEKVPNRSQIMSQVHRTAWARHTTK